MNQLITFKGYESAMFRGNCDKTKMNSQTSLAVCLLMLALGCTCTHVLPIVNIDLDAEPQTRWIRALETVLGLHGYEHSFEPAFAHHNVTVFSRLPAETFKICGDAIAKHFPKYAAELQGLAAAFNRHDVTYNYLAAWVYFHEFGHVDFTDGSAQQKECTAILVQAQDGTVLHGRNMDQQPASIRNMTLHLKLYSQGKLVGDAVDWYWFNTGFVTAQKPGVVSMQGNWRDADISGKRLIESIANGIKAQVWVFREVLENPKYDNFESVINFLQNEPSGAPMYNVVAGGGVGEGAIITKDIDAALPVIRLSDQQTFLSKRAFPFLVQTNYDNWQADPADDNRRTQGENLIGAIPYEDIATPLGLFTVMDSYSIHNEDTIYTIIMIPRLSFFRAIGQNGITDPANPQ